MDARSHQLGGASMLLASAFSIQIGAALATTTFDSISPAAAAGLSFVFAALLMLVLRPLRPREWSGEQWRDAIALGLTAAVGSAFLFLSLDHLPLGSAVTIEFLGPLAVAIFSGRGRVVLGAAALALVGTALVAGATPSGDLVGVLLALVAAVGWGLYILAARRAGRHADAGRSLTMAMCTAAVVCLPLSLGGLADLDAVDTLAVLALVGVFGRALPYALELAALRRVSPSTAGVLFSVEPALAAVVGAVGLGQGLAASQLVGIAAVAAAGALVLREVPVGGS